MRYPRIVTSMECLMATKRKSRKTDPMPETVETVDSGENTTVPGFEMVALDIASILVADAVSDPGRFISEDKPAAILPDAEALVVELIDAQVGIDGKESHAIVSMIEAVNSGAGDVKAFVECYKARAADKMAEKSLGVRASNLKGVLSYALENAEFAAIVQRDRLNLQAAYALRAEMKGPKHAKSESVQGAEAVEVDAVEVPVDAMSVLCQQLRNAIGAAETAQREDIADDLRDILARALGAVEVIEA
jgi:hypothetical protein